MKRVHVEKVRVMVLVSLLLFSLTTTCLLLAHTQGRASSCQDSQSVHCLLRQQQSPLQQLITEQDGPLPILHPNAQENSNGETSEDYFDRLQSRQTNEQGSRARNPQRFPPQKELTGNKARNTPKSGPELSDTKRYNKRKTLIKNNVINSSYSGSQRIGSPAKFRGFPPLYQAVLPNGMNCRKVWTGDQAEVTRAQNQLNDTLPARRPPGFYQRITQNCEQYRQQAGYIMNVSEREREFPLAFSLMVYKEVEQVERLLRAVYRPHNAYCLHMDLKTHPRMVRDIRSLIRCLPNVYESGSRLDVVWGHFSVLHMELLCMNTLWTTPIRWKYLINLTGQEFPIKTNKELVSILTVYNGANDILGKVPKEQNLWRWKKAGKPPPHNITVAKGPVHVAASRGFVDFALHSKYAQDLLAWTKKTGIPDETFFATLNNMHQFGVPGSYTGNITAKHRIMLNRFKLWDVDNRTCSGKFVRSICHFGPREVSLLAHSRHLVANKFSYDLHPLAWDCTEQWYFDRLHREDEAGGHVHLDLRPYRNLVIVKHALRPDHSPWA